jgi:DNA replication and repair protein RecF
MTGADPVAFTDVAARADIFDVEAGTVKRRG